MPPFCVFSSAADENLQMETERHRMYLFPFSISPSKSEWTWRSGVDPASLIMSPMSIKNSLWDVFFITCELGTVADSCVPTWAVMAAGFPWSCLHADIRMCGRTSVCQALNPPNPSLSRLMTLTPASCLTGWHHCRSYRVQIWLVIHAIFHRIQIHQHMNKHRK